MNAEFIEAELISKHALGADVSVGAFAADAKCRLRQLRHATRGSAPPASNEFGSSRKAKHRDHSGQIQG
jgi:hypothetical protein